MKMTNQSNCGIPEILSETAQKSIRLTQLVSKVVFEMEVENLAEEVVSRRFHYERQREIEQIPVDWEGEENKAVEKIRILALNILANKRNDNANT